MNDNLSSNELVELIKRVFLPTDQDSAMAIMVDLPDDRVPDKPSWAQRRAMAADWAEKLRAHGDELGLEVDLVLYANTHMNNADLPDSGCLFEGRALPALAQDMHRSDSISFEKLFSSHSIVLAPTEFSATAPLKLAAAETGIRAATMPGFSNDMIPALRLDYGEINRRVQFMTDLLTRASEARFVFRVDEAMEHELVLDLRHRTAHASGGLFPTPGKAGNLPSGESYIVPYEGELLGDDPGDNSGNESGSNGVLPVELQGEVVLYRIVANKAVEVLSDGPVSTREAEKLHKEPAYGNLAELGIGVLGDFGLEPTGEILLDEKLGLHIAFGRSDHFGGQVGPAQFSSPDEVVHIDRVYVPALQPRVIPVMVNLHMEDGDVLPLMRDGSFVVQYPSA